MIVPREASGFRLAEGEIEVTALARNHRWGRCGLLVPLLVAVLCCAGPKLREPKKLKPKKVGRQCQLEAGDEVSRAQAQCIAEMAGLHAGPDEATIEPGHSLRREPIWLVEERCTAQNPRCIAITIRKGDGVVLNVRYLYVWNKSGGATKQPD